MKLCICCVHFFPPIPFFPHSFSQSLSVCFCLCFIMSLCLSLSFFISLSTFHFFYLSLSLFPFYILSLFFSLPVFLSLSFFPLYLFLSLPLSYGLFLCIALSFLTICLSLFLSHACSLSHSHALSLSCSPRLFIVKSDLRRSGTIETGLKWLRANERMLLSTVLYSSALCGGEPSVTIAGLHRVWTAFDCISWHRGCTVCLTVKWEQDSDHIQSDHWEKQEGLASRKKRGTFWAGRRMKRWWSNSIKVHLSLFIFGLTCSNLKSIRNEKSGSWIHTGAT